MNKLGTASRKKQRTIRSLVGKDMGQGMIRMVLPV